VAVCGVCGVLYDEDDETMHLPTVEEAAQYAIGYGDGNAPYGWHTKAGLLLCSNDDTVHQVAVRVARESALPDGQMDLAGHAVHQPDRIYARRMDCNGHDEEVFA
jgi:hypothetical protein